MGQNRSLKLKMLPGFQETENKVDFKNTACFDFILLRIFSPFFSKENILLWTYHFESFWGSLTTTSNR